MAGPTAITPGATQQTLLQGADMLGEIVSWTVPSRVAVNDLRNALILSGLSSDLASDLGYKNALKRALRDMDEHRVIKQVRVDGETTRFQINRVIVGSHIEYPKEAEVTLNTVSGSVASDDQDIQNEAVALLKDHLKSRKTSDLTRLVQRIFDAKKADLIPIREQGGAYFVPEMHADLVEKVRTLLRAIGGNLRSFAVKLGSDETKESVAQSMVSYFEGLIAEFIASCEGLDFNSKDFVKDRRRDKINELRGKLSCYQGLLDNYSERIVQSLNEAERILSAKIVASLYEPETEPETSVSAV